MYIQSPRSLHPLMAFVLLGPPPASSLASAIPTTHQTLASLSVCENAEWLSVIATNWGRTLNVWLMHVGPTIRESTLMFSRPSCA
ncbi:hypothetical protein WG66_000053 [Moniliophthora roreri]|nr:hypothetical protein WG66_000053 [Moniliophthora roreri]